MLLNRGFRDIKIIKGDFKIMNILFVASDNDAASGAFLSMVRLCTILKDKYNHNVHVVIPREGKGQELLDSEGIPYHFIRTYNWISKQKEFNTVKNKLNRIYKLCLNTLTSFKYKKLIKKLNVDVVHMNTSWTYLAAQIAERMNLPFVWHIREFLEEDQNVRMWNREMGYGLIGQAACVIAISESIKLKYEKLIPKANLIKIYNGIDVQKFYVDNHSLFKGTVVQFLIVGSISVSKGQEQLLDACTKVYNRGYHNFFLKVVGRGQEEYISYLKKKVALAQLEQFVDFSGYRTDVHIFYREADITFVCSKAEAFGRVTVEAMLGGSLVIGARSAATVELISDENTGLLYQSEDSDSLTERIIWSLEHMDQVKHIAKNGQRYMCQNMTAENNAKLVNEVYCRIKRRN